MLLLTMKQQQGTKGWSQNRECPVFKQANVAQTDKMMGDKSTWILVLHKKLDRQNFPLKGLLQAVIYDIERHLGLQPSYTGSPWIRMRYKQVNRLWPWLE